jgi:hypothetical protein
MGDRAGYTLRPRQDPRHRVSRAGTGEAPIRRVIPAAQAVANAGVRAVDLIGGE